MLRASVIVGSDIKASALALAAELRDAGAAAILADARAVGAAPRETS